MVLGLEDTGSRMSRIAKGELANDLISVNQVLAAVDAVTPADVHRVAQRVFAGRESMAVIGPYASTDALAKVVS
jgi:hypothetical protein